MSVISAVAERLENPVAVKEMRSRMRDGKAFVVMAAYVAVLSLAMYLIMREAWDTQTAYGTAGTTGALSLEQAAQIGRNAFMAVGMIQLGLVCLIAPALTSGTITLEREQQTLDLLRMTRLSSGDILAGKLASSLSYLGILIAASVPVASLCFLLGGVSPTELLAAYALTVVCAMLFGAIGMFWSSVGRKTSSAGALSYATLFILIVGVPVYGAFMESLGHFTSSAVNRTKDLAYTHYVALVVLCIGVLACAGALLVRWVIARTSLKLPRAAFGLLFGTFAAGLAFFVAGPLLNNPSWHPTDMQVTIGPNPFLVMGTIVMGADSHGPWPGSAIRDITWYWMGAVIVYLAAAVDLIALTIWQFNRLRARE